LKHLQYIAILLIAALMAVGCEDYDSWSTSQTARLEFSEDTISFDTIITKQSSTTRTLMVFNHNDEGIRISHIALEHGSASPFRVNVDGQYLSNGVGDDFEVRRKDSIYVRAEVTLPETDGNEIVHYEDKLTFTLESGVQQQVTLMADGMNVYILYGLDVKSDTTLLTDRPYIVYDSLTIQKGATLTLQPGTTLMFHDGVDLNIHGSLYAVGTQDSPITFRGDRVDNMLDYLPYDNTPNRWGGIHIYGDSRENVFYQCDIHSGDYGIICDSTLAELDTNYPTLVMQNSVIHNVGGDGLVLNSCIAQIVGCQISNTLGDCVYIMGGAYDFVHCTIAQFYPFDADRGNALYLANAADGGYYAHLYWAYFLNCVITGYADDVIMGSISEGTDLVDYKFANSLLRTPEVKDDARYLNIVWDNEDLEPQREEHFVLFDTDNFIYDFTPDSASAIRGIADLEYTRTYSTVDRLGRDRMADGAPDAGCYEYVQQQ